MATTRNALDTLTAGVSTRADLLTYFNSNLDIIDAALAKCNFVAASDPEVTDDSGDGYAAGSMWFNTTDHVIFACEDATAGAAVWRQIYPPPSGGDVTGPASATDGNIVLFNGATGKVIKNSSYSPASFTSTSHNHISGAGAAIAAAATTFAASAKVLGRKTSGAGVGEECSISELLDASQVSTILDIIGTEEQGDIIYRGASAWALLPHGTDGQVLKSGGNGANPSWMSLSPGPDYMIAFCLYLGGTVLTTGIYPGIPVPAAGTITAVNVVSNDATSGSIVVDLWKDTYANAPPTNADSITASAPPTLSSATKSEDTTLTDWTKTLAKGDIIVPNIDSVTSLKVVTVYLTVARS